MLLAHLGELLSVIPANERDEVKLQDIPTNPHIKNLIVKEVKECLGRMYEESRKTIEYKRALGYCSTLTCLNNSGKHAYCWKCTKNMRNRKRSNLSTEYGKIRREERKSER